MIVTHFKKLRVFNVLNVLNLNDCCRRLEVKFESHEYVLQRLFTKNIVAFLQWKSSLFPLYSDSFLNPLSFFFTSSSQGVYVKLDCSHLYCKMTSEELFHLPLNIYISILGVGLFILMLSLIFCCYLFRYDTTHRQDWDRGSYWTSISVLLEIVQTNLSSSDHHRSSLTHALKWLTLPSSQIPSLHVTSLTCNLF